jgi:glycine C-acetyltransferase
MASLNHALLKCWNRLISRFNQKPNHLDIFEKIKNRRGPLGQYSDVADGYFAFPKLEGEIGPRMMFRGKERLVWSLNNYIGLANHPEVREADAKAAADFGMAYPMGARMMSGQTKYHEQFEQMAAEFMEMEAAYLLNYGYQGFMSIIDALVDRNDVIVYDSESHACLMDGLRLHMGKRFVFQHNDMDSFRKQLQHATKLVEKTGGGILVITEGVFGMAGDMGKIKEIVAMRKEGFQFRLLVDDAHGFGTMGARGRGAAEEQGVHSEVDIILCTFAKSMASIGAFVASTKDVITYLRYNMRSQIFAKSLPLPITIGAIKRLELLMTRPELREKLWTITRALQNGLREAGYDLGRTNTPVTPVFLKGNEQQASHIIADIRERYNIFCSIVLYPVVPKGVMMLRLIPTADHSLEDVAYTVKCFKEVKEKLESGGYSTETYAEMSTFA